MSLEARLAALEQQQALIQARQDIWQTIARYARGIDEQRDADLAEIFTEDVVLQTEPWTQRPLVGKALTLKALRNYRGAFQHPRRFITNHQLDVHNDGTATGYANWFVVQSREESRTVVGAATSGIFATKMACGRSAVCSLPWTA